MKKTFDSVKFMRQAREKLSREFAGKPVSEEIKLLREQYPVRGKPTRKRVG